MHSISLISSRSQRLTLGLLLLWLIVGGPVQAADNAAWRVLEPSPGKVACQLQSVHKQLFDGYIETPVYLSLDDGALRIVTDSKIDASLPGGGIQVDGGPPIPIESVEAHSRAVIRRGLDAIVARFRRGRKVQADLHFWPSWPATGIKTVDFSLKGFTRAYTQWQGCVDKMGSGQS